MLMLPNEINRLCLWKIEDRTQNDSKGQAQIDVEPILQCEVTHKGDTTDLVSLSVTQEWRNLHFHSNGRGCPCTSIAMKGTDSFVSVGEDGRLCFVNIEKSQPLRVIEKADSCTLNAASFLKQTEVAAVNSIGQLKVWDLRQSTDHPSRIFLPTGDRTSLHCLDKHPTQPHIVCTGGQDGALTIWDMRQERFPVTVLQAHSSDMWEVKFHPTHPDHLFTCSEDGSVWHWDASNMDSGTLASKDFSLLTNVSSVNSASANTINANSNASHSNPWLASEASKHRMDITDLLPGNNMPVNSLDILENNLLCGTDGEQIYTVVNLLVR